MLYAGIGAIAFTLVSPTSTSPTTFFKTPRLFKSPSRVAALLFFIRWCPVPGLSHAAPDREQEALDQPRGVRLRRSLHLRRRHSDFHLPPANHRGLAEIRASDLHTPTIGMLLINKRKRKTIRQQGPKLFHSKR